MRRLLIFLCPLLASAQLIPDGQPVPRTALPPVVFANGYQLSCNGATFANTFGQADQVLQRAGRVSLFFNNCAYPNKPPIEELGAHFGEYLDALRFTDGSPVPQIDVVAHSMGGLIVRSYLAGKGTAEGVFAPPLVPKVRRIVFLGTPHFGTTIALGSALDVQVAELTIGSKFLYDLATWNQGQDDLRGIRAAAVVGNAGTSTTNGPRFDDGVVSLTSGSLGFSGQQYTRVVPYCHITGFLAGFICSPGVPGIADITDEMHQSARVITAYLGESPLLIVDDPTQTGPFPPPTPDGGLFAALKSSNDEYLTVDSGVATAFLGSANLDVRDSVAYRDKLPAQPTAVSLKSGTVVGTENTNILSGTFRAVLVKNGPHIRAVIPSAALVQPRVIAPGSLVTLYGSDLTAAQIQVNGAAIPLQFLNSTQANFLLPESASGLIKVTVLSVSGRHTVNVLAEPAVPAVFTLDQSGSGPAAATNAVTGAIVTTASPLTAGDAVAIYATGLGATTLRNGLAYANRAPTVVLGGRVCPLLYAGRAPGYPGLDQINCVVPTGLPAGDVPLTLTSGDRTSNAASLAIR